jgi:hypothetical protein
MSVDDDRRNETAAETTYGEPAYDEPRGAEESDGGWLDVGLIGLALIVGVILFLFPEPITSTIGVALIVAAVIAWIVDALL